MKLLLLLLPFTFYLLPWNAAHAQSGSIQVSPAYIDVVLGEKDSEKTIELSFKNTSSKSISLDTFPIDFRQGNERGGISFLGKESSSYSYSLSSFLTFESNRIDLEGGEEKKFTVTIKNRPDLSPGGHYAAVVARLVNEDTSDNTVSPALSSLIFMRKTGGEIFNLSIRSVDFPDSWVEFRIPSTTQVTFQNEGNVHVIPYGRAEVKDIFGRLIYKGVVNTSSAFVLPETRRLIDVGLKPINAMLPISISEFSIYGSDSVRKTSYVYKESFIYINPIIIIIFLIIILLFLGRKMRRKKKSHEN